MPEQIAKHEVMHDKVRKGEVSLSGARELMRQELGEEKFTKAVSSYSALYEGTGLNADDIFEEMICDAAGNMNEFVYRGHMEDALNNLDAMRSAREADKKANGEGKAKEGEGEGKFARDNAADLKGKGILQLNIPWDSNNNSSIKEQMTAHLDQINKMEAVVTVNYDKESQVPYYEQLEQVLSSRFGYKISRADGVEANFDKKAIADVRRYVLSDADAAAVIASPYVIKRGEIVSGHKNHKGKGHPSLTFAAPAVLNGRRGNIGVAVLFTGKDKVHAIRVVTPDGKEFILQKEDASGRRDVSAKSSGTKSSTEASDATVPEVKESVKPYLKETFNEYKTDAKNLALAEKAVQQLIENEEKLSREFGEKKNTSGIRTLGIGITREMMHKGRVNLLGREVKGTEDIARMCQIFRNPMFETLRYLYVKNGKIVGMDAVSARMPGISPAIIPGKFEGADIAKKMNRLKADGYYLLHNHPSGRVTPSEEDIAVTRMLAKTFMAGEGVPMLGHVVIDHEVYSTIDSSGNVESHEFSGQKSLDMLLTPSLYFKGIGEKVNSPETVADVAKAVASDSVSAIIYVSNNGYVRQIQEVDNKVLLAEGRRGLALKQMESYIRNQRSKTGAGMAFVYTTDRAVFNRMENAYETSILTDLILDEMDGTYSARKGGQWQDRSLYMGKSNDQIFAEAKYVGEPVKFSRDLEADYDDAVRDGDMKRAQELVDDAAEVAGYTFHGMHGTTNFFTIFNR